MTGPPDPQEGPNPLFMTAAERAALEQTEPPPADDPNADRKNLAIIGAIVAAVIVAAAAAVGFLLASGDEPDSADEIPFTSTPSYTASQTEPETEPTTEVGPETETATEAPTHATESGPEPGMADITATHQPAPKPSRTSSAPTTRPVPVATPGLIKNFEHVCQVQYPGSVGATQVTPEPPNPPSFGNRCIGANGQILGGLDLDEWCLGAGPNFKAKNYDLLDPFDWHCERM
jgi:hypothetical protein